MNKVSKDLIKSLGEAADHVEGGASSARVHVVDVRAIRRKLHLSQQEFAQKYRIPLPKRTVVLISGHRSQSGCTQSL
jgi:DNA-binding transcriptional regulator YiaG